MAPPTSSSPAAAAHRPVVPVRYGRWHLQQGTYRASFPQGLEVTFVDTTPLLHKYHKEHWVDLIGGYSSQREDSVKESQRLLLESSLNSSTAKFKLVVGHHPVVSLGDNCQKDSDCDETSELFIPLLEQYNVTAYLNGHEHDLQYIESSEGGQHVVSYVVTGAGSDVAIDEFQKLRQKSIPEGPYFLRDDQGFVAVVLEGSSLDFYYYVSSSRLPAFKASREQK
ncbi:hypothetical protein CEUSTIGMA_g8920.t1 [Chlamydomonas eustigma]|uniref:Calcineurin-like phosphoesterase domain-containing protein n=1 Tax=Chlamydomonas eustigma TaxID=1157962 RepID=A0A250XEL8_9CHLO|nr:hypothetical protein CEUSTIGMA_g8920.t1 [Chlamydomonas eustigma]|eukprot:GAX81491.1 hypothetical protein CEUSTIGMA_g8920.t1 [Chlamydomonas eustigma]